MKRKTKRRQGEKKTKQNERLAGKEAETNDREEKKQKQEEKEAGMTQKDQIRNEKEGKQKKKEKKTEGEETRAR